MVLLFLASLVVACAESGEPAPPGDVGSRASTSIVSDSASPSTTTSEPTTTDPRPSTTFAATPTFLPPAFPARRSDIGLGWESVEIPSSVGARCHTALVGTDNELFVWGGNRASCEYESPVGDPGLAYNPDTGMWRQLPEGPLEPAAAPTGVWTGSEVMICCGLEGVGGVGDAEIGSNQAAAFDPSTDFWTSLADAPLGGPFPASVWTGNEMVVVTELGVAAYNPATDSWREFPPMSDSLGRTNEIAWTGSEVTVWPVFPVGDPLRRVEHGMTLDPATDTWRVLPDPPQWPSWLDMVFTGDSLVIWGGLPANSGGSERAVGSRLDLDADTWTALPEALPEPDGCECNLGSQTLTWTGEYVLVSPGWFSSGVDPNTPVLIAYHPVTDTWILVDDKSPLAWGGNSLHVGDRLVMAANDALYVSPPDWQPTGDTITPDTWNN
jgi:hypothetical protein